MPNRAYAIAMEMDFCVVFCDHGTPVLVRFVSLNVVYGT